MRKSCSVLSAVLFVFQAQIAFGQTPASLTPGQRPVSRGTEAPALRMVVAQTNPAPAQQPAPQPPATLPAQRTETINYDNWIVTCREMLDGPKKRNCSATVAVTRSETGQTVFALSVQPNDQGRLMALIQTPTGVSIAPGVEVKFDSSAVRKFPIDYCEPARCVASLPADTAFVREISAAGRLTIVIQSSDGKPVNFEFPVKGFDKAYTHMAKG